MGLRLRQFGLVFRLAGQLAVDVAERALQFGDLPVFLLGFLLGPLFVFVVQAQPQDLAQHLLALGRSTGGEGVGSPLEQKGRVGKRLIVHAQQADDGFLGGAHARLGNGAEGTVVLHLQVQQGAAAFAAVALAEHAVGSAP